MEKIEQKKFTRFEKARIIGARSLQISQGAPLMIELSEEELKKIRYDPIQIAKREFDEGVVPLTIIKEEVEVKTEKKKKK